MKKLIGIAVLGILLGTVLFWPSHTLLAQSGHSITLGWKAPTTGGAPTSYNVKRSTTSGTEATIASVPAPTLTYSDTTGTGGVTYFYVVTAVNTGGESAPSNEVSATFLAVAPGSPSGLTATAQ